MEHRIATRWTDFDALGHLTHAAYPVFLDEARDAYLRATVGSFTEWPNVIVHLAVDFRRESCPRGSLIQLAPPPAAGKW